ncbi:hypothetical protein E3V55_03540 [Candidatus Marinimicrobia bacterium MT.SAG.3]|nr:hypothetical protein E3V55_03540 [Candidatus Marinimicrobia bacterium MT.SAG.3]
MAKIRRVLNKEMETYDLDYYDHTGKRVRKRISVGYKTAERMRKEIEVQVEKIKLGLEKSPTESPNLDAFITDYLIFSEGNKSYSTVKREKYALDRLLKYVGNIRISNVTSKKIDEYILSLRSKLSKATIGIELRHLKASFNVALRWNYIEKNPFVEIKIPDGIPERIRVLTKDEIKLLLSVVDDFDMEEIIRVYLSTGARRAELLKPKFTWDNVNFRNNRIRFDGKGGKTRYIPMTATVKEILFNHQEKGYEFPLRYGQDHVSHKLRDYYKKAKIKNATLHTLRKTFGSLLLQDGYADIFTISKLLGHSSVKVTEQHYIYLLDENYQSSIDGMEYILKSL